MIIPALPEWISSSGSSEVCACAVGTAVGAVLVVVITSLLGIERYDECAPCLRRRGGPVLLRSERAGRAASAARARLRGLQDLHGGVEVPGGGVPAQDPLLEPLGRGRPATDQVPHDERLVAGRRDDLDVLLGRQQGQLEI